MTTFQRSLVVKMFLAARTPLFILVHWHSLMPSLTNFPKLYQVLLLGASDVYIQSAVMHSTESLLCGNWMIYNWLLIIRLKYRNTWIMERNQHEVLDWSCSAAQGSLQNPRSTFYHLFEIVVHRTGNIEDKGQCWSAVIRAGVSLHRRDGWGTRADSQRQNEETNEKLIHSCLEFIRPLLKRVKQTYEL